MSATPFSVYKINPFKFTLSIFSLFYKMFPCPSLFYEIIPLTLLCSSGIFLPTFLWDISPSFPIYEIFPRYVLWDIFPYFSHLWDISPSVLWDVFPTFPICEIFLLSVLWDISPSLPIYEIHVYISCLWDITLSARVCCWTCPQSRDVEFAAVKSWSRKPPLDWTISAPSRYSKPLLLCTYTQKK